ncbi:MAG: glycoside hydrolase family 127 protein [Candidatus Sumerlaeota bacterium]|nr:glycoside hydrolase family 127 protein [Candidatus Sumerlaeota bacterium]
MDFGIIDNTQSPQAKWRATGLKTVKWSDGFWARRFEQVRHVALPHLWKGMHDPARGHVVTNFRILAGLEEGQYEGSNWQDEWVYKWVEAAAYVYAATGDAELDRQMDELISLVAQAQAPDGYLSCNILKYGERLVVPRRHELYNMGHLITAACAHHHATGKRNFLDVAIRCADYLHGVFVPLKEEHANFSVTKSYLMAVVDLYRVTRDARYLDLAGVFIDLHGRKRPRPIEREPVFQRVPDFNDLRELNGTDIRQSRVPLREESFAVGHAVNSMYLYCGAADYAMERDDPELRAALERIWTDLVTRKLYVHGGVCPLQHGVSIRGDVVGEAHGREYELPNTRAYNETCAQIGSFMWNWRLLLMTGEARYADVMELQLYNSILACVSLDGDAWFYTNPLRWHGEHESNVGGKFHHTRYQPVKAHTCCPTNLTRAIAGLHGYLYSVNAEGVSLDHYGPGVFDGALADGTPVRLRQETDYPWDGRVRITLERAPGREMLLRARIPGWAEGGARAVVNGQPHESRLAPSSYLELRRRWRAGDVVELDLPMDVQPLRAHPQIDSCRNAAAVRRGPILYCLESPDLPAGVSIAQVRMPREPDLQARYDPDLLGGVTVLEGAALADDPEDYDGPLYRRARPGRPRPISIRMIPYYAWANRGVTEMAVWIPLA